MFKTSKIKYVCLLIGMSTLNASAQDDHRNIRMNLPNQLNNLIKTPQPGVGCWFWVEQEFKPEGYKPFIDLYARYTNFQLLTTSIRHDRWVGDPAVHNQVKEAASYARSNNMGIVFDLDIRHSRESFREKYPDEMQELVRMREIDLKGTETITLAIQGMTLGDHYTFGPAPDYDSYASRLLRLYSYDDSGNNIQDITNTCQIVHADGKTIKVAIPYNKRNKGRKACVMAAFTMFTPDVFSPHLPEMERSLLEQYADVPLAGACKDEWGFPGRFNPSTSDLWYSESMAKVYAERRPGHDLARDMLLMFNDKYGKQPERLVAINHYMQMVWQESAKVENMYYESIKDIFGDESMVMTHPTWVPFPNKREIFKNGLDWWSVKRDLAQTDETTPYCVRTALAKKWNSPLWYNMYYNSNIDTYKSELWQSLLGGGRLNYHQIFPYPNWLSNLEWNKSLLKDSLMQAESRVQLLNYISTKLIDCPVAVIFGHAAAINWTEPGFADVGLKITDKLWETGFYADLIPSSEIENGSLKIGQDGSIQYGDQHYAAAVLHNPEYEQQGTAEFFAKAVIGNKTKLFRVGSWSKNFDGTPLDAAFALPVTMKQMDSTQAINGVVNFLQEKGIKPYTTSTSNNAGYGSSMTPGLNGQMRLLDGTVIHASGEHNVMGDPIQKTFEVNGHPVSFDAIGIAAVRLTKKGQLEAIAAGGLKSFQGGGLEIFLQDRVDIALWKDSEGIWQGILQGHVGDVPEPLKTLCRPLIKNTGG